MMKLGCPFCKFKVRERGGICHLFFLNEASEVKEWPIQEENFILLANHIEDKHPRELISFYKVITNRARIKGGI